MCRSGFTNGLELSVEFDILGFKLQALKQRPKKCQP